MEITHRVANHFFVEVISAHVTTEVADKKPCSPLCFSNGTNTISANAFVEKKDDKKKSVIYLAKTRFFGHYLQFRTFGRRSTCNFCQPLPCFAIFSIGVLHSSG